MPLEQLYVQQNQCCTERKEGAVKARMREALGLVLMEVNRVEREHKLFCELWYSLFWPWATVCVCECVCVCVLGGRGVVYLLGALL